MCGKRFKQKGNVKPHIENVHEKKRRWICKFYDAGGPRCGKDFSTIGNMKVTSSLFLVLPQCNPQPQATSSRQTIPLTRPLRNYNIGLTHCFCPAQNHINGFHKETLQGIRYRLANWSDNDRLSEEDKELFAHYLMVYKNSNKGVKGRGKSDKIKDDPDAVRSAHDARRETTQQMTPESPDPNNMGAVAYRSQ